MTPNSAIDHSLRQAFALHQSGDIQGAEALYRQVLAVDSNNFTALRLLGTAQMQQGNFQVAVDLLRQAIKIKPRHGQTLFDLGRALSSLGNSGEALKCFEKVLVAEPTHAEAHNARGIMLTSQGRRKEAMTCFQRAANLNPQYPSPHNNLGNEHLFQGHHEEALACYDRALALQSSFKNAWIGRGNALLLLGRGAEALESYHRATQLDSRDLDAWNGRGNALSLVKRHEEALECYARAQELNPRDAGTYNNQANVLALLERDEEALAAYEMALAIGPVNEDVLSNRGQTLVRLGRHRDALESYRRALDLNPATARAHVGMGTALRELGHYQEAIQAFEQAVAHHPGKHELLTALVFNLNYVADIPPADVLSWHKRFGELVEAPLKPRWIPHANTPEPDRPLRVGFVSGDLRQHPVGFFMEGPLLALARRGRLVLHAYANQPRDDELTSRLRACFSVWRDIWQQPDDVVAAQIRADGIDILVDLSGHTDRHRLPVFARKPAPVQVTYLGYSGTTGLTAMDYILGNRWLMPEEESDCHTEAPYRLPDTQICFTPPPLDLAVSPLPMLKNGFVTFGNYNNIAKMNDASVACWARVLKAVPDSRLVLKAKQLEAGEVADRARDRFKIHGIQPERLILLGRTASFAEHLASYGGMDIALDPFPYNGTTTSMDALWMGVPVLTLYGDRYISRVGAGIMQVLEMPEWVARDETDYIARAARFAADSAALAAVRAELRQRFVTSPLCDAPRFAEELERALRQMWRSWCTDPTFGFARRA